MPRPLLALPASSTIWLLLAVAIGCGAGSGGGYTAVPPDVPRVKDGLHLVTDHAEFEREYLKPGLDLGAYRGILLLPVELLYSERYQRQHRFDRFEGPERMVPDARLREEREADLERLRKLFREALERELASDGSYRLVSQPGAGVLVLSVGVMDLDLEPADAAADEPDATTYGVPPVVTLAASLKDGKTGEHLVEVLQSSRSHQDALEDGDGVLFWGDVREAFAHWSRDLAALLEHVREAHPPRKG